MLVCAAPWPKGLWGPLRYGHAAAGQLLIRCGPSGDRQSAYLASDAVAVPSIQIFGRAFSRVARCPCCRPGRTERHTRSTRMHRGRVTGCEPVGVCPSPIQPWAVTDDRRAGPGYSRDAALDRAIGSGLGTRVPPEPRGEPGNWGPGFLIDRPQPAGRTPTSSIGPCESGWRRTYWFSLGGRTDVSHPRVCPAPFRPNGRFARGANRSQGRAGDESRPRGLLSPRIVPGIRGVVSVAWLSVKRFWTGLAGSTRSAATERQEWPVGDERQPCTRPGVMADCTVRSRRSDAAAGGDARVRLSRPPASAPDQLKLGAWEREMRRLRVTVRLAAAGLLALAARVVVLGINTAIGLTGGIVAGLLVAPSVLARHGRRLEATSRGKLDD
jgi:hypothetical protein